MKISFIQTGGTIDKDYPHTTKGWAFEFGEPATIRILDHLQPSFEHDIHTCFQKDSLEINDNDRQRLVDMIIDLDTQKIIVTHGTDTMIETAQYIAERVNNKLVVLTGAMRPERFSNSDAAINLGCAIATANLCDKGVYIAMHGVVKPYNKIRRDLKNGKYY